MLSINNIVNFIRWIELNQINLLFTPEVGSFEFSKIRRRRIGSDVWEFYAQEDIEW